MNMRDLLNKLDTVSESNISEFRVDAGRPHDFYRHDNYYGNPRMWRPEWREPRMWGINPLTGLLFTAAEIAALSNQGVTPMMIQQMPPQQVAQVVQAAPPAGAPPMPSSAPVTSGPAVPVGQPTTGATKYYNPNGDGTFQDHPYTQSGGTAGDPVDTTKDDADKAAKISRFKELLAKAGVSDKPTGLDSVDKPFNPDYSLTGGKSTGGIGIKESSINGFARDPLLEKLRLIESGHKFNEGLTPEESKELDKLYGDLSVTGKNDPKLAPLFAQYNKVPSASAADPTTPNTAADPADTTKPQQWAPGVLHVGSTGPEVIALQKQLGINADGKFGPATKEAVMAMQKKLGVTVDGAWGPKSKAAFAAKGGTAPSPSDTTKGDGKWTGSAKDWGSAIGGGLGTAAGFAGGGLIGTEVAGPVGTMAGAATGAVAGHDIGADLGGKAGEWLGQAGDKIGKSWDAAKTAWNGKPDNTAAAPAKTTKESIEVDFANQLIESFGYQPK